jgi:F-type H+-transporting ATPase subunit delta
MTEIAKEYAEALFSLAKENGDVSVIADGLNTVREQFIQAPAYVDMLASPVIPKSERVSALQNAFGGKVSDAVLVFMQLLCQNGHIRSFFDCCDAYTEAYREMQKISVAHIVSAAPLEDAEKALLERQLSERTGHTVHAEYTVDPALIGGVTVEIDGTVLDGSLKNRLRELKEVISI